MPENAPVRVLHLFSDRKFLPWVKQTFSTTGWTSSYVILNPQVKKTCLDVDGETIEVSTDAFGRQVVQERLSGIELAFHYFLDNIKADIIYDADPRILHCWCFYGAEIYQQTNLFRKDIYGPATKRLLWSLPEIKFRYDLRKYYFMLIKHRQPPIRSLLKAIPRINRILWYVEEEIEKINTRIKLPQWSFFQFFSLADIIPPGTPPTQRESPRILLGNSATIENNHLEALKTLVPIWKERYTLSLPLTYGQFPRYKEKMKSLFKKRLGEGVFFLEEHLKLDEYYQFLQQHPTAIFLHYRQQGLGNILYLLYTGTKVYLSRQNVVHQWLTNHQVKVYIFEDQFAEDFKNNDLVLDDRSAAHNKAYIIALLEHNRNEQTLRSLENKVLMNRHKTTL